MNKCYVLISCGGSFDGEQERLVGIYKHMDNVLSLMNRKGFVCMHFDKEMMTATRDGVALIPYDPEPNSYRMEVHEIY